MRVSVSVAAHGVVGVTVTVTVTESESETETDCCLANVVVLRTGSYGLRIEVGSSVIYP